MKSSNFAKICPKKFVQYLDEAGWRRLPQKRKDIVIFQNTDSIGKFHQVTVPLDNGLLDYSEAIVEAVNGVARYEGRSIAKLIKFIK